jgi:hypothetical protein
MRDAELLVTESVNAGQGATFPASVTEGSSSTSQGYHIALNNNAVYTILQIYFPSGLRRVVRFGGGGSTFFFLL